MCWGNCTARKRCKQLSLGKDIWGYNRLSNLVHKLLCVWLCERLCPLQYALYFAHLSWNWDCFSSYKAERGLLYSHLLSLRQKSFHEIIYMTVNKRWKVGVSNKKKKDKYAKYCRGHSLPKSNTQQFVYQMGHLL
jgi:hypothetical protein